MANIQNLGLHKKRSRVKPAPEYTKNCDTIKELELVFIVVLAPVVQRLDNAIHRINHYPADSVVCFINTYPLDSDLSSG